MPSPKVIAAGATAVVAAGVIAAVVVTSQKKRQATDLSDDDEAFTVSPSTTVANRDKPPTAAAPATASATADSAPKARAANIAIPAEEDVTASLLDDALAEISKETTPAVSAPASAVAAPKVAATSVTSSASGDRTELPHLGVSVKVPKTWEVREELSPVPNVAMVTIWNPAFSEVPNAEIPGVVPVIIVSIEDVRGENLNLIEFKDRSKELSMQQMSMMAGGIPPMVRKDAEIHEGPFRHIIEYSQSLPPFFDLSVINLIEVRNGVAYVLQIMANPKAMNQYKSTFMQIARDLEISGTDPTIGYVSVKTGRVEFNADATWSWDYPQDSASDELLTITLPSTVKKEKAVLYPIDKLPTSESAKRSEKVVDGVTITSVFDGSHEVKTFTYGDYALVVTPQQKAVSFFPEAALVKALKSAKPTEEKPEKKSAKFICNEYGFKFNTVNDGRVIASKLGKGTVVYAPMGITEDMSKSITITIRVGNPENDPDCESSVEAWKTRMENETEANISGIKIITAKGMKCLTFMSKEMQETGPGQSTEVRGTVHIFVRNGETTLIRWECESGLARRHERDMGAFLESFEFIE